MNTFEILKYTTKPNLALNKTLLLSTTFTVDLSISFILKYWISGKVVILGTYRNCKAIRDLMHLWYDLVCICSVSLSFEEGDALASSVSANMQQLNIQEERQLDESEEDIPSVVIPNHLQVQNADCSHLSFGSFGTTMNPGFAGSFASRQLGNRTEETSTEPDTSSVRPFETRFKWRGLADPELVSVNKF
ncbi:hypothetical protein QVD17_37937 [Tagetes erecta]|uniref:Uncharacterized protein n=1 Tax=Tagetes erecta TaxID=13708 RepID=A0AAD8JX99_TARER|nr:hypothetical protein QVD17_37937 [Tagetes erecta]